MLKLRKLYERVLEWIVIVLMTVLAVEVTVGVVFRTIGHSLVWYDEVASILLAWLTFYGSAYAAARRGHISCPELVAMMPPGPRLAVTLAVEALVIGFFALLGVIGWQVLEVLATDTLVSLPSVPVSFVQSVIPISAALIIVAELLTLPEALAWARTERAHSATADGAAHEASH
ncbi:MAG TPA: TRAP transporter small permease [Burkholderiaceae bacterium]|jgi:TRAP-type C4-dicarboxylate transport system permease small subunit|nr:TRAP transporter small permease [Burkholderiaceae bacterium]